MAKSCDFSGKSTTAGKRIQHKHAAGWRFKAPKSNRTFLPNLRKVKVKTEDGRTQSKSISMKYYKKLRKQKFLDVTESGKKMRYFLVENV